ncbi:MAG: exosome complex RNA-binding protein Rrp4 [archaeon]
MTKLLVKEKEIVVPGQALAEGLDYLPGFGAFRDKDKIIATRLGIAQVNGRAIKIIPLSGCYNPKKEDIVIGHVIDITIGGWRLEINSTYSAMISMKDATNEYIKKGDDLTKFFDIGDVVVAQIINVTSQKLIDMSLKDEGLGKLGEGRIIKISPNKIPRVIGKGGSMVTMIKNATHTRITVGQNGLIWVSGEPEMERLVEKIVSFIEENAHTSGVTDKVKALLDKEAPRQAPPQRPAAQPPQHPRGDA